MKTQIKEVYKYLLDNCKYYTVTTNKNTYYNVIFINYSCCNGYSSIIYIMNINNIEMLSIHTSEKNTDILQVKEQEKFIYF